MFFKRLLRDIPTSVMMILGLGIIMFLGICSSDIINNILISVNRSGLGLYTQNYGISVESDNEEFEETFNNLFDIMKSSDGSTAFAAYSYMDGSSEFCVIEAMIGNDISQKIYNLTGEHIGDIKGENLAVINSTAQKYCVEKDGVQYINFWGQDFRVCAAIENGAELDSDAYIFYDSLTADTIALLKKNMDTELGFTICVHCMEEEEIGEMESSLADAGYEVEVYEVEYGDMSSAEEEYTFFCGLFLTLTYIFAFINCVAMSDLWIRKRIKEFAIRRIYGLSRAKLILKMILEIVKVALEGAVCGMAISFVYMYIFGGGIGDIDYLLADYIYVGGIMAMGVIISMILPLRKVLHSDPIRVLQVRN